MKIVIIVFVTVLVLATGITLFVLRGALATGAKTLSEPVGGSLWAFESRTLAGEPVALADWQGKVALVVNVASKCGLTPQYEGLEALYQEYQDEGLVILAFPSNDFMGQEPGSPEEIRKFCENNYQITFPMFEKSVVKGDGKSEIYAWLTGAGLEEPTWNFTKYLIGRDGKPLARYAPRTAPDDPGFREAVSVALAKKSR